MHARELIELAAIVSAQGPVLVRGPQRMSSVSIEDYWTASRCRLDRWNRLLKDLGDPRAAPVGGRRREGPPATLGLIEEILTGEVLTRVWTAVMTAYDRHHQTKLAEPVARSILLGHMEARHQVLRLLVQGTAIDAENAVKLNHLRSRMERWTDLLVGYLTGLDDVEEFAVDPERAKDFAEDLRYQGNLPGGRHSWPLVLASLKAAFHQGLLSTSPSADLNRQIATAILSAFPSELFDSTGTFHSLWLMRLSNATADTEGLVAELLQLDDLPVAMGNSNPAQLATRLRRFGV